MPRWFRPLLIVAIAGFVLSAAALVVLSRRTPADTRALRQDEGLAGLRVPEFSLVNQDGTPVTQAIFDGKVTVLDFVFTNCPLACPIMTSQMKTLHDQLAGTPVRFVSISVDPGRDTPERLAAYAVENGADRRRWSFLTGDYAVVERLCRDSFLFALDRETGVPIALPDGSTMRNVVHPTKFMLIGPDRRALAMYDPNIPGELDALRDRARAAAAATGR